MPKYSSELDLSEYAPVAERIRLFYERYPSGRIVTELVSRTDKDVVFKALVFRASDDARPAATGWAAEREGDGEINLVACLENTETSAVGRALANLGFTASRHRPSAEEMAKASRARARHAAHQGVASVGHHSLTATSRVLTAAPADLERATYVDDLLGLIARAERLGLRAARARRWRTAIAVTTASIDQLTRWEHRLRVWVARRSRAARLS